MRTLFSEIRFQLTVTSPSYADFIHRSLADRATVHKGFKLGKIMFGTIVGSDSRNLWLPTHTDMLFSINGRADWSLGIFASELLSVFSQLKGKLNLPV